MLKITLPDARMFAAALICMSDEETRPYLKGVHLEPAADGGVLLTATDGHRLFHGHQRGADPVAPFEPVTIRPAGKAAFPAAWTSRRSGAELEIDTAAGLFRHAGDALGLTVAEGPFPDYPRIFPRDVSGEVAQFNARYLADFDKAGCLLTGNRPGFSVTIGHNGDGPALIRFTDVNSAFGVLMPVRPRGVDPTVRPTLPGRLERDTAAA